MKIRTPIKPIVVTTKVHVAVTYLMLVILAVFLVFSVFFATNYFIEAKTAKSEVSSWSLQMAECLNGTWRGKTETGAEVGCLRAEINDLHK